MAKARDETHDNHEKKKKQRGAAIVPPFEGADADHVAV